MSWTQKPMATAPRDGTVIIAWHTKTGEPMAVQMFATAEKTHLVDWTKLWGYMAVDSRPGHNQGFVHVDNLSGWAPIPTLVEIGAA